MQQEIDRSSSQQQAVVASGQALPTLEGSEPKTKLKYGSMFRG